MASEGLLLLNSHAQFQVDVCVGLSQAELLQRIPDYDCLLVRSQTSVDKSIIDAGVKLKLIGRAGVGIDNIDVDAARANLIAVINTPAGNTVAACELAFGLMLSLARQIPYAHQHVRDNKWQRSAFKGTELFQKTLGLIGFGNIGRELAKRARAFNMQILAHDPLVADELFRDHDVRKATLDQVLAGADFLSLHCNANNNTRNMINEQSIAKMKRGAMLINTARGELIEPNALIAALDAGHLSGAALDVFKVEPPVTDPLVNHPKVIVTPHIGASTAEAQLRVSTLLAEQTIAFFNGSDRVNRIV